MCSVKGREPLCKFRIFKKISRHVIGLAPNSDIVDGDILRCDKF